MGKIRNTRETKEYHDEGWSSYERLQEKMTGKSRKGTLYDWQYIILYATPLSNAQFLQPWPRLDG